MMHCMAYIISSAVNSTNTSLYSRYSTININGTTSIIYREIYTPTMQYTLFTTHFTLSVVEYVIMLYDNVEA